MKRITVLFVSILSVLLVMILPVKAAEFDLVSDEVGVLTEEEYVELNELAMGVTEQYNCEVSIVVIEDKGDDDITELANLFYDDYGYGYGADKSGLMLLISMKDRDYTIISNGYGDTVFTDYEKDVLIDQKLLPLLGKDNYYDSFSTYLNQTAEFLEMAQGGTPFDMDTGGVLNEENTESPFWSKLAITILIPLLISGVICMIFLSQMKSAVPQTQADNYIPDKGFNMKIKEDKFLSKDETRTRIEQKPPSGGKSNKKDDFSAIKGKF